MILTIDVGNTNITFGAYKNDELLFVSRIATQRNRMADEYACEIIKIFELYNVPRDTFSGSIISCVVPEILFNLEAGVQKIINKKPLIVGPGIKTGLNIHIDAPSTLGADLVTSSVAVLEKYPLPCLVVDLGTASKITVIDENGSYIGGAIVAGVNVSLNALSNAASLLPNISIQSPKAAIGRNTVDSLQSGAVFGTAAMIDGLIERFQSELSKKIGSVVATGGLAKNIVSNCKSDIIYDENLILDGLKKIYDKNVK